MTTPIFLSSAYFSTFTQVYNYLLKGESKQAYSLVDKLIEKMGRDNYAKCSNNLRKKFPDPINTFSAIKDLASQLCFISLLSDRDLDYIKFGMHIHEVEGKIPIQEINHFYQKSSIYTNLINIFSLPENLPYVRKDLLVSETLQQHLKDNERKVITQLTFSLQKMAIKQQ